MADRIVYLKEADGSISPIIVPDKYTDEQVSKRYNAPLATVSEYGPLIAKDYLKSAQAGVVKGLEGWLVGPGKLSVSTIGNLGNFLGDKDMIDRAREGVENIKRLEKPFAAAGGDYMPQTKTGEYIRGGVAGAVQPWGGGLKNTLKDMFTGLLSGVAGQGAYDANLGEMGVAGASMVPWIVRAAKQGLLTPASGYQKAREATDALTPEQRAMLNLNLERGREAGVNPMIWQAAPEGSQLRNLGVGATQLRGAEGLQARVTQQLPGHQYSTEGAVARVMDPRWQETSRVPVNPGEAEFLRNRVANVARERNLPVNDVTGRSVLGEADRIGQYVEVPVPQQALLDELIALRKQINAAPAGTTPADMLARRTQLQAILGGSAPWPTTRQFSPNVRNVGEVEAIRQYPGSAVQGVPGAQRAVNQRIQEGVNDALPVAGYGDRLREHGEFSDAVNAVRDTAARTAGRVYDPSHIAARTELGPEVLYAAATNPGWALMRPAYRMAEKANARILDDLMQATSIEQLTRMAAKDPRVDALASILRGFIAPLQQGTVEVK